MTFIEHPVRDRAEGIMCLIYAPDRYDRTNTPLYGKTRLQKAAFLLARRLDDEFNVKTGFDFKPHHYGPYDAGIEDAITLLENQGYLSVKQPNEHGESYDLVQYRLTDEGTREGERIYRSLPDEQRELVDWVKNKHALKKLGRLITYVYNEYPEMTTESKIA